MNSLYQKWEKDNWQQHWYLGMEPEDVTPSVFVPHGCGFWLRVMAWMLDNLLVGVVIVSFMASLMLAGWLVFPHTDKGLLFFAVGMIVSVMILKNAYYTLLHSNNGQTVGQAVLGIKVVDAQGFPPSLRQAARRRSARFLSFITFGFGYLWMLFDSNKQTLHDKIAGTYVVMA